MSNNDKEKGMIKKFMGIFKKEENEIDEQVKELILKHLDNGNYELDNDKKNYLTVDEVKAIREANNIRLDNKKAFWETVKIVAQVFGVTIGAAVSIVGIIYTVKGHNFDVEWMNRLFEAKDSLNVIDPNSRTNVGKHRDNMRKAVEHMTNKKIDIR